MKNKSIFSFLFATVKENGFKWIGRRSFYELQRKIKWHNLKFKSRKWRSDEISFWLKKEYIGNKNLLNVWMENQTNFFFDSKDKSYHSKNLKKILNQKELTEIISRADSISDGFFHYFSSQKNNIGFPPDWFTNPKSNKKIDSKLHWNNIPMYSIQTGDLKYVWEIGRFTFVYDLVRAYWITSNDSYPEAFWEIIEDFYKKNPPNYGPHWKCGQEISIRIMAICFGLYAFRDTKSTTSERFNKLITLIASQADRVSKDHIYSHLQFNNHSISEGVGLYIVGLLFPELKISNKIRAMGKKILEFESKRLIFDDGSFAQNSFNYHRLMLSDYIYALRLSEINDDKFSNELKNKINKAYHFLLRMLDQKSGKVPNYGGNDGALILPLNICDYQDYRPIISLMHFYFYEEILFELGPWHEDLLWLFGHQSIRSSKKNIDTLNFENMDDTSYFRINSETSWCMIRCGNHQTRPSHSDMLHLDLWKDGINITADPGSYLYYDKPWNSRFMSTSLHNTISIDGFNQMDKGPRFMWYNWTKSKKNYNIHDKKQDIKYFEGEHYGYLRLQEPILHKRAIFLPLPDTWIVIDDLIGKGLYNFNLHWLTSQNTHRVGNSLNKFIFDDLSDSNNSYGLIVKNMIQPNKPLKSKIIEGSLNGDCYGWSSNYYGIKEKKKSILIKFNNQPPLRILSIFANDIENKNMIHKEDQLIIESKENKISLFLNQFEKSSILSNSIIIDNKSKKLFSI
tara:strand:- start:5266 stop:7479 length:2214 start_codon:yes stop_codon:yes gene_type:complete